MARAHPKDTAVEEPSNEGFTLEDLARDLKSISYLKKEDVTIPKLVAQSGKKRDRVRRYLEDLVKSGKCYKELRFDAEAQCNVYAYLPCSSKSVASEVVVK